MNAQINNDELKKQRNEKPSAGKRERKARKI